MAYKESTSQAGWAGQLVTPWDVALEEQDWLELVQRYGNGFDVLNFVNMAGKTVNLGSNEITIVEEGVRERPVTVSVAQALTAPIDPVLTFSSADDSDDYVREGMTLLIPASYVTGQDYDLELRVWNDAGTWKGKSFSATATIDTAITTKEFLLTASSYGEGADGIDPMTSGFYERTTNGRILKEACGIEGGRLFEQVFKAVQTKYGTQALLSKEQIDASFRLDSQIDAALLTSNKNTNTSNLVTASIAGGNNVVRSFDGLIPSMKSRAAENQYTTNFDMDEFRATKAYLEAAGVLNRSVSFLAGSGLISNIETQNIDWLKTNSSGHTFYEKMKSVGFFAEQVYINSVMFDLMELHSFANINKFGGSEYSYSDMGFIFPKGERNVTVMQAGGVNETMKLPHLTLGYANNQGENRTRVVNAVKGNTDIIGGNAANSFDGLKFDFMSHIIPIFNYLEQTILVTPA